ncbi:MAG: cbb3-type cytochrome c oxidase N-terminal domain-containing protein [Polyangiaceae bacterium]
MNPQHNPNSQNDEVIHECAGIREMNNPLPRWWLVTFYGAIVFAFFYFFHYEVFHTGKSNEQELEADLAVDNARKAAEAEKAGVVTDDSLLAMSKDATMLKEGEASFQQLCVSCHGEKGEGKIGPNLTDNFYLHGGKPTALYATVSGGVSDKGMPQWGQVLGPAKTQRVVAYVVSLKGKNIPGKAPQGVEE